MKFIKNKKPILINNLFLLFKSLVNFEFKVGDFSVFNYSNEHLRSEVTPISWIDFMLNKPVNVGISTHQG